MSVTGIIRFAGFDLPATIRPSEESLSLDTATQARPRASGSVSQKGRREVTSLTAVGSLTADYPEDLDALVQALKAKVSSGYGDLYFGRDDRYYKLAQCRTFSHSTADGITFGAVADIRLTFEAADFPEAFGVTVKTPALSAGGGTITVLGDAAALPTWTITVGTGGTGTIILTNSTTGETAVLERTGGFLAGDILTLTRDGYLVKRNGVAEFGLLKLRIPTVQPGANVISITHTGAVTAQSAAISYIPRFA